MTQQVGLSVVVSPTPLKTMLCRDPDDQCLQRSGVDG